MGIRGINYIIAIAEVRPMINYAYRWCARRAYPEGAFLSLKEEGYDHRR